MKKKLLELRQSLTKKVEEAKRLIEEGKVEEARAITAEAEEIKAKVSSMEKLEALEEEITDVDRKMRVTARHPTNIFGTQMLTEKISECGSILTTATLKQWRIFPLI